MARTASLGWAPDVPSQSSPLLEGDALLTLLLSDADLLHGVGGKGVRRRDQRGLSTVAIFISDVGELSNNAVRESKPVRAKKDTKELGFR